MMGEAQRQAGDAHCVHTCVPSCQGAFAIGYVASQCRQGRWMVFHQCSKLPTSRFA